MWGTSSEDVFAVGENSLIVHFDGISWSVMDSGMTADFNALWVSSPTDVYVGGLPRYPDHPRGVVLHFDGRSWTEAWTGDAEIRAMWGSGPRDIFAVGFGRLILHYDGESWSEVPLSRRYELDTVWGTGPREVYAFSHHDTVLHYDGVAWEEAEVAPVASGTVSSTSPGNLFTMSFCSVYHSCGAGGWP